MVSSGAISVIVGAVKAGSEETRQNALAALHNVASRKVGLHEMLSCGTIGEIVESLNTESDETIQKALAVLFTVAREKVAHDELVSSGAISVIVGAVNARSEETRQNALAALDKVASRKVEILSSGVVCEIVRSFNTKSDETIQKALAGGARRPPVLYTVAGEKVARDELVSSGAIAAIVGARKQQYCEGGTEHTFQGCMGDSLVSSGAISAIASIMGQSEYRDEEIFLVFSAAAHEKVGWDEIVSSGAIDAKWSEVGTPRRG
jgi:hypothetical protein